MPKRKREETQISNVVQEFSRFAHLYDQHNMIQTKVAKRLVEKLPHRDYGSVLDLGCGSGEVFKNMEKSAIEYEVFTAFDSSLEMLALHPKIGQVETICGDFNDLHFPELFSDKSYDLVLSSSALQWSADLDFTLATISRLSKRLHAAIFTSNTFKTLHQTAGVTSPIYSSETLQEKLSKYYDELHFELHTYTLQFASVREMFKYIKKSGVSSGEKKLSFKETKALMKKYPLDYLEFEVLFVEGKTL